MTEVLSNKVLVELRAIREEITYIKKHMVDVDSILTAAESKRLDESLTAHKAGKAKDFDAVLRELRK